MRGLLLTVDDLLGGVVCGVVLFFFLIVRRPPRSTQSRSSAASDVYKRQQIPNRAGLCVKYVNTIRKLGCDSVIESQG